MTDLKQSPFPEFTKTILIDASVANAWNTITVPDLMQKWLFDDKVKVTLDLQVGGSINVEVVEHWVLSKATGKILELETEKLFKFTQLSSLSRLSDEPKNHCILEFRLLFVEKNKTQLTFSVSNFPTESIYKHMVFYWNATVDILKKFIGESIK